MRTECLIKLVPVGHVNFEIELRLRIRELFPSLAQFAGLLFGRLSRRTAKNYRAGLQRRGGTQGGIQNIVRRNDSETDRFSAFLSHGEGLGEKLLLDAAKQLVGLQFVLAAGRSPQ